jgi:hypothetical protein
VKAKLSVLLSHILRVSGTTHLLFYVVCVAFVIELKESEGQKDRGVVVIIMATWLRIKTKSRQEFEALPQLPSLRRSPM